MASTINVAAYSDALVVLGTAGIVVPIVSRLGFSPVLGYLGAGALLGPLGLGSLIGSFPSLYWFTVGDAKDVAGIAELGVVFLLFLIGLELSLQRLLTMRRLVFGLGGLQVLVTTALLAGVAAYAGSNAVRGDHPRRQPVAVLDRDRARTLVEPGAPEDQCRPRKLCRAAAAGPRRHPDPDVRFDSRGGLGQFGARQPRAGRCCRPRWRLP